MTEYRNDLFRQLDKLQEDKTALALEAERFRRSAVDLKNELDDIKNTSLHSALAAEQSTEVSCVQISVADVRGTRVRPCSRNTSPRSKNSKVGIAPRRTHSGRKPCVKWIQPEQIRPKSPSRRRASSSSPLLLLSSFLDGLAIRLTFEWEERLRQKEENEKRCEAECSRLSQELARYRRNKEHEIRGLESRLRGYLSGRPR